MKRAVSLLLVLAALLLSSCSQRDALANLRVTFPAHEIVLVPGSGDLWILRAPDGSVFLVEHNGVVRYASIPNLDTAGLAKQLGPVLLLPANRTP